MIFGKIAFTFPTTGTKDAAGPLNQELVSLSRGVWTDPSTEQSAEALARTRTETVCHTPESVHGRGGPHRTWTPSRPEEDRLGLGRVPARNDLPRAGSDPDLKRSVFGLGPLRPEFDPFVSGSVHAQCRPARTGTGPTPPNFTWVDLLSIAPGGRWADWLLPSPVIGMAAVGIVMAWDGGHGHGGPRGARKGH